MNAGFEDLTPDRILDAVEEGMDCRLTGLTSPLPSYINRVYELQSQAGEKLIAKFYRPGRWNDPSGLPARCSASAAILLRSPSSSPNPPISVKYARIPPCVSLR